MEDAARVIRLELRLDGESPTGRASTPDNEERAFAGWSHDDRRALFALLDRVKVWFDQDRDRVAPQATRRQS